MRVPFLGFIKKFTSKGGRIEAFLLYYLIVSIVIHLLYSLYLEDIMVYKEYYHDEFVFTFFNLIILFVELLNFIFTQFGAENLEVFNVLLKFGDSAYDVIVDLVNSNQYSEFIFANLTWTYIYIFTAVIIVMTLLKKVVRISVSIAVIGVIIYVIYSTAMTFIVADKYSKLDYESSERFDSSNLVEVSVVDIVDGDTIKVIYNDEKVTVRLLYIDTPENTREVEEYGQEATDALRAIIRNSDKVYLEFDGESYDKYDRLLAWVWCDDVLAQEVLTKNGLVEDFYDYGNYKYEDIMLFAMNYAKDQRLNIYETH